MSETNSAPFNGGMNSDNSPIYQPKSTYVDALNIEFINDKLQGSIGISNSKGNKFQKTIPDTGAIYKLTLSKTVFGPVNLTINSATNSFTNLASSTHKDLYDFIKANFSLTQFNVYYDNIKVVIVPISPSTLYVSVDNNLIILGGDIANGGVGPYIPAQINLQPIGYGIINEDIYIFSTNNNGTNPQLLGGGIGQIWKLKYDNINFDASLSNIELIYSEYLSFTTYYHIPQTAVVTRYENLLIQRIYWTDNYNKMRQINVADPQVFALDISSLDLIPSIDFDIPILTQLKLAGSVSLKVGAYQLAYRLKKTTGSITNFSPLSNIVYITTPDENSVFKDYVGSSYTNGAFKTILWTVDKIDLDFDRIEFVVLVRETKNGIPTIYSFNEDSISGRESITVTFDGASIASLNTTTLTLSEFIALSSYFTHAKTIATKDNRLIAGNIRSADAELEFDARVYRQISYSSTFDIINNGTTISYPSDQFGYKSVPEDSDAINPDNTQYRYRINSETLGGDGENISYEFVSIAIKSDTGKGSSVIPFNFNLADTKNSPLRSTVTNTFGTPISPDTNISDYLNINVFSANGLATDILQEYPTQIPNKTFVDMKYPQYNAIYWGYQQNEIYRIGIQFYDNVKNPYFVKWIGDIKFPDIIDNCPVGNSIFEDGTDTGQPVYSKSFTSIKDGVNIAFITQLGLKLNIRIPANLTGKISGYSIVRVKREEADKTVIAEGIITSVVDDPGDGNKTYYTASGYQGANSSFLNAYNNAEDNIALFVTPNLLDRSLTQPMNGDKITARSLLRSVANINGIGFNATVNQKYYIYRLYQESSSGFTSNPNLITASQIALQGTYDYPIGNTWTFDNRDYTQISGNLADPRSMGCDVYVLELQDPLTFGYNDGNHKLYATIDRELSNQYGGNTYADRSNNEYILCSHFRKIKSSLNDINDYPLIFGGDTMNYHIDIQRNIKKWVGGYSGGPPNTGKQSSTFIFAAGACLNVGFRQGDFMNATLLDSGSPLSVDSGIGASGTESFIYNSVYSTQNDIIKFFPKPDPFMSNNEFPNRFRISEIKINGELSNSWNDFKENNYWDVEGTYGPINSSLIMADKLYFWQDRAFGIMQVSPETIVQSNDGVALLVGTGLPLQRHDYISTVIGTQHQSSTISSDRRLYWLDINTKKIQTFDGSGGLTPFSDIKGEYAYLNDNLSGEIQNIDKPLYYNSVLGINGVAATYDYKRHKAIFTFHSGVRGVSIGGSKPDPIQTSFTFVINELTNTFTTRHSFLPRMYINDFKHILSGNPLSNSLLGDLYIHDEGIYGNYYGTLYPCYIKFIVNDLPVYNKVFDNIVMDTQSKNLNNINQNNDTWSSIRVTNDYQNTDIIPLVYNANIKRKERNWQLAFPRNRVLYTVDNSPNIFTDLSPINKPFGERLRDKYISIELTYNNLLNNQLITNSIKSSYRQSSR